jgi:hypothetical protein
VIVGLTTPARPSFIALSGGAVGLAYRDNNGKFQSILWNCITWQGPSR